MKSFTACFVVYLSSHFLFAQNEAQPLASFDRIVASPFVNVVLHKGENESIRLEYHGVEPSELNVKVKRNKLHIYLDNSRLTEKQDKYYYNGRKMKVSHYGNASVTAYVTYKNLRGIEIRGEEGLVCHDEISADKFKLKVYGNNEVSIASLKTKIFRASIFGSNDIKIKSGTAGHQLYRLFGENQIDTQNLNSNTTSSRIYGEGRLTVSVHDELRITAFGDPEIRLAGTAAINRNLILGEPDIKVKR